MGMLPKLLTVLSVVILFLYTFKGSGLPAQLLSGTVAIVVYFVILFAIKIFSFEEIEAFKRIVKWKI